MGSRWVLSAMIVGIIAGGLSGYVFGHEMEAVAWIGELFLRMLKMVIVPLIVASMVVGVSALGDVRKMGRIGVYTMVYFAITTGVAVVLGIVLVSSIKPGVGVNLADIAIPERVAGKEQIGFKDIILSLVSPNIVEAMAKMDVLPVVIFSLVLGGLLSTLGRRGETAIAVFDGLNEAIMRLVHLIMYTAPLGVFALVASRLGKAGGGEAFVQEVLKIGLYTATVLIGLVIHGMIILPAIVRLVARRPAASFTAGMGEAFATAFSTASSSATLPVTLQCTIERNRVSPKVARFVCPLGATVNMNGTALYEAVAAIFVAQAVGHPLGLYQLIVIFLTATLAAIGAAGIPEAGLVTMVIVLRAVDLPLEGIGLILAVDWFLDRCRTTVNVWGDSVGAAVVDRLAMPHEERKEAQPEPAMAMSDR